MQSSYNTHTPKIVGALVIFAVTASGAFFFLLKNIDGDKNSATDGITTTTSVVTTTTPTPSSTLTPTIMPTTASTPTATPTPTPTAASTNLYKDGSYSVTASYSVPHGQNSIAVTIVIKDDVIASVSDKNSYGDGESASYISSFEKSISSKVVGKSISSVTSLSRVGGASLTTAGFNKAIQSIAMQAKA